MAPTLAQLIDPRAWARDNGARERARARARQAIIRLANLGLIEVCAGEQVRLLPVANRSRHSPANARTRLRWIELSPRALTQLLELGITIEQIEVLPVTTMVPGRRGSGYTRDLWPELDLLGASAEGVALRVPQTGTAGFVELVCLYVPGSWVRVLHGRKLVAQVIHVEPVYRQAKWWWRVRFGNATRIPSESTPPPVDVPAAPPVPGLPATDAGAATGPA